MAGDWIKMRVNLVTNPKVMAIAEYLAEQSEFQDWSTLSGFIPGFGDDEKALRNERYAALRVTRYVTVCALLRFWGYANEHCRDEFIEFMSIEDIDEIVQIPCFGSALATVGWVIPSEGGAGINLPNFNEFNAAAIDRTSSAERQKRYRERKKEASCDASVTDDSDVTRDVTNNAREEKRREEKKETKTRAPRFDAQAHLESLSVDSSIARDWLELRKAKKLPVTETAVDGVVREAEKAELSLDDALRICCERGWAGFNAKWLDDSGSSRYSRQPETTSEKYL
jgi:hypothetical protein